jgi:hypothetical protein
MVEARYPHDRRLKGQPKPSHWPMFALWQTPEARILQVVEHCCILQGEGLPENQALQQIDSQRRTKVFAKASASELQPYIVECLRIDDPEYLILGESVLRSALVTARRFAEGEAVRLLSRRFPPREWLKKPASAAEIANLDRADGSQLSYGWSRILVRRRPSDEFWSFASPTESWKRLCGQGGIALVRGGECIDHVITIIN